MSQRQTPTDQAADITSTYYRSWDKIQLYMLGDTTKSPTSHYNYTEEGSSIRMVEILLNHIQTLKVAGMQGADGKTNSYTTDMVYKGTITLKQQCATWHMMHIAACFILPYSETCNM
jgi:hypothetical protein